MPETPAPLETLVERFAHPAVRVMARELSHLARDWERGTPGWPGIASAPNTAVLPGLEGIERALAGASAPGASAVTRDDWARFARTVLACVGADQPPAAAPRAPSVIALRLIWGGERMSELPTVILKPPPAAFLEQLARLPAPARQTPPAQLDQAVTVWLEDRLISANQPSSPLPVADARGFARFVAACRAVGHMRREITVEDVAASYLAWIRLLRADPQQLSDISSGWWSSTEHPSNRRAGHEG